MWKNQFQLEHSYWLSSTHIKTCSFLVWKFPGIYHGSISLQGLLKWRLVLWLHLLTVALGMGLGTENILTEVRLGCYRSLKEKKKKHLKIISILLFCNISLGQVGSHWKSLVLAKSGPTAFLPFPYAETEIWIRVLNPPLCIGTVSRPCKWMQQLTFLLLLSRLLLVDSCHKKIEKWVVKELA